MHEAALKRITALEATIKTTTSEHHSLLNKFKDLDRKVSSMSQKHNNRGGGNKGGGGGGD